MKTTGPIEEWLKSSVISALDGDDQFHAAVALPLGKVPLTPIKYEAGWDPKPA
jgi:hypothetical protein